MTSIKTKALISIIIGVILVLLISTMIFSLFTVSRIKNDLTAQIHTHTAISILQDNLTYILDAETGGRGFVITNDPSFLESYHLALQKVSRNIQELKEILKNNPHRGSDLKTLQYFIDLKLNRIAQLISLKQQGNDTLMREMIANKQGKVFMDNIRKANNSLQEEEELLYVKRRTNTSESIQKAKIVFICEGLLAIVAVLFLAAIIITELRRRTKTENILQNADIELERKKRKSDNLRTLLRMTCNSHYEPFPILPVCLNKNLKRILTKRLRSIWAMFLMVRTECRALFRTCWNIRGSEKRCGKQK